MKRPYWRGQAEVFEWVRTWNKLLVCAWGKNIEKKLAGAMDSDIRKILDTVKKPIYIFIWAYHLAISIHNSQERELYILMLRCPCFLCRDS